MLQNIFDSHAHYDSRQFGQSDQGLPDRDALLGAILPRAGVRRVMNVGSDYPSSVQSLRLAKTYPFVSCAVGVHPESASDLENGWLEKIEALAGEGEVRAIGEIGLDYHYEPYSREDQLAVFSAQLELAGRLGLPVIVHSRDAVQDTMNLLREYRPRGIVHCFSGSAEPAKEVVALGMYVGFTGVVTFKNAKKALKAAEAVPPERLLVETDCPYMAPEPHRGQRCDSSLLPFTIAALAKIKGVGEQELADLTYRNACKVYGLPDDLQASVEGI